MEDEEWGEELEDEDIREFVTSVEQHVSSSSSEILTDLQSQGTSCLCVLI
jgi:hypothetical protein